MRFTEAQHKAIGQAAGRLSQLWLLDRIERALEDPETQRFIQFLETGRGKGCPGGRCGAADRLHMMWARLFLRKPKIVKDAKPKLSIAEFLDAQKT